MSTRRIHTFFTIAVTLVLLASASFSYAQSGDIKKLDESELVAPDDTTGGKKKKKKTKQYKPTEKKAMEFYWAGDFRAALSEFLLLLPEDPKNVDLNFYIGNCYLETNIDKSKAIEYLEFVTSQEKFDKEALYQLGRAYHFAHRFDDAIVAYNKYKDFNRGKDDNIISGDRSIEMAFNAKELAKYPIDVTFENLGSSINTPYPEFNPFIPEDESFIVFTTKRPDCLGLQLDYDGYKTADIYRARERKGSFVEARNIGSSVNTEWVEECVGISADGMELLVYIDNFDGYDDIYVSPRKGRFFDEYVSLGENINSDDVEVAASMSVDGSLLFLSREAPGGKGGTDIYMARRLPNGKWGKPKNVGETINTEFNESFPHLMADMKTLYFCSEGHTSMGGFDIFTSTWDELTETWSTPRNIGYPANTVDDDYNISFSTTGRYGYGSYFRPDGFGERDIYRITFNSVAPPTTILRGSITNIADTLEMSPSSPIDDYTMTITDNSTNELIGYYRPNKRTSNYISILPPGEYCVYVESPMFYDTSAVVEIYGKKSFVSEIIQDFTLRPDPNAKKRLNPQLNQPELPKSEADALTEEEQLLKQIEMLEAELEKYDDSKDLGYNPDLLNLTDPNKKFKIGDKIILERIYFDFDKYDIRDESVVELSKLYTFLNQNPDVIVEISGHTDSKGSDDYNLDLSRNRAKSVVSWLKKRGIKSRRVQAKGYGEARPIADNINADGTDNPDGRQMNRRIELRILSVDGKTILTTEDR